MVVKNHPSPRSFLRGLSRVMEVLDKRDGTSVTLRLSTEFSLLLHDPGEDTKEELFAELFFNIARLQATS